ncbi:S1 family peptidase [Mesobacillus foraminis]|uniref:Trypsin-like peptidase n=1 Tax=Mesobacillus foraminis TaxID=279826 RepID=A0A4R2BET0_9BACI|nr:serine protease [Mesobacillus foraminis]TCN25477.1 trypsin-like peptidase [Mesobacillus foraminis]
MDILDQLSKSTVKIHCDNNSSGTGFFFNFHISANTYVPTIITNRHVMENVRSIKLVFSLNDYFSSSQKIVEKHEINYTNVQNQVIYHSDPDIDLCAIKITPILQFQLDNKMDFEKASLDMSHIPSDEVLENLRFVEDVLMVGYPNGLSDVRNNLPIFRKGFTATHPGVDFEGRPECVIDMAVTPGSSGSPVFIHNSNGYMDRKGNVNIGSERLIFLGINKAVYTMSTVGEIIEIPSPTRLVTTSNIGINLGIIVKSKAIKDLEKQIIELIQNEQ